MSDQKNLLMAVALSVLVLGGYHYFFERPAAQRQQTTAMSPTTATQAAPTPVTTVLPREEVLKDGTRIQIDTPQLKGSINLRGLAIDDLSLTQYKTGLQDEHPVVILSPANTAGAYHADFGWVSNDKAVKLPTKDTLWTTQDKVLKPGQPVTLHWENDNGLLFERIITVDDKFMFTITDKVINKGDQSLDLHPYGMIVRKGMPKVAGFFILHEGPIGVFDDQLKEVEYKKLQEKGAIQQPSVGGWLGITDKYWLVGLIPDQQQRVDTSFKYLGQEDSYQADFIQTAQRLLPGQEVKATHRLFAGAKVVQVLDYYTHTMGIKKFDLAIDFGWFYFLTKPIFYALNYMHAILGNFGIAILLLTVLMKLLFFPLANKSYRSMAQLRRLQPEIERLQQRYADDKMKLNQEMMALYQKEKVNPMAGCLPMLLQFPVFFALYKVLFISIEMRHAPFFGWVKDLAAPDPTSVFNLFGLIPWSPPEFLLIGLWPLIMGITMIIQQRMNPQPADPVQAKMFMVLPVMFTVMLAQFPVGLVIYWAWSNLLSIVQQWVMTRQAGRPA